jgi:hypothetical protein
VLFLTVKHVPNSSELIRDFLIPSVNTFHWLKSNFLLTWIPKLPSVTRRLPSFFMCTMVSRHWNSEIEPFLSLNKMRARHSRQQQAQKKKPSDPSSLSLLPSPSSHFYLHNNNNNNNRRSALFLPLEQQLSFNQSLSRRVQSVKIDTCLSDPEKLQK